MKHNSNPLLLLLVLCFSVTLFGQKNEVLKKANKQYDLHAYNLAIKSYKEVLQANSNNLEALSHIADCYRHLGRYDESADFYKRAIQQAGVDPINLMHYGKVLMAKGDYEAAEEWFLIYAEGQPHYGKHYAESCRFARSLRGVSSLYRVKKEYVNTNASDFGLAFYGDQVVYSSARKDMPRKNEANTDNWEGAANNQLYISSIGNNGLLTDPRFLLSDLKNTYNEGSPSYSENGNWVAFAKNNFVDGTRQIPSSGIEMSIYLAEATGNGGWENARAFPYNGSGYSSGFPHLSADGRALYFASNRPDGFGGYDLYVSYRTGSTWSTPENMGPVINSEGNEITPYMEEGVLYFASDWHHGLGGFDIFRAASEDGIWNKVFHLGNAINSSGDDYGLIYKARSNRGYFVSNRKGGVGNEDIYQLSKLSEDIVLKVFDANTQTPINGANLDFSACGEEVYQTDAYGKYSFQAFEGLTCNVLISKSGYRSSSINITSGVRTKSKEIAVSLSKLGAGEVVSSSANGSDIVTSGPGVSTNPNASTGLVVNATNNQAVGEVYIKAISKTTGAESKTISDANGRYELVLANNDTYIIRYSKAGFTDTHQQIMTKGGTNKAMLGVLNFIPSGTNLESKIDILTSNKVETGRPGRPSNSTGTSEGSTSTVVTKVDPVPQNVQEGFSIQVAAVGADDKIKISKYESLSDHGNLYGKPQNGMKKIRVGIYASRAEAEEVRKEITAKGFKKSFIVAERLEDFNSIEMYKTQISETPEAIEEPIPELVLDGSGRYMVRLATYKNAKFFDPSKVESFGRVTERIKGDMTIKLLSGYVKRADAEKAKLMAIESGFRGAHIVIEENGVLKKI